jgi:hypothetical protein
MAEIDETSLEAVAEEASSLTGSARKWYISTAILF